MRDDVFSPVAAPSRLVAVVRVLAALVVVAAFVHWLTGPVERTLGDLLRGLESGEVTRVVLGRPAEEGMIGGFVQRVEWEVPGRDGYATYEVNTLPGRGRTRMPSSWRRCQLPRVRWCWSHATSTGPAPPGFGGTHSGSSIMMLLALITGPQPRWATKWAWFWLSFLPLGWVAFLLLEPVPVWRRAPSFPPEHRFTGGWRG